MRHAQSLLETQEKLKGSLQDAFTFVEGMPHNRLWQLLAREALTQRNFQLAIKAFVLKDDYKSVQFVKQVRCHSFVRGKLFCPWQTLLSGFVCSLLRCLPSAFANRPFWDFPCVVSAVLCIC